MSRSGVKRTWREYRKSVATDPERTLLTGDKAQRGHETTISFIAIRSAADGGFVNSIQYKSFRSIGT
jgi:hypothetical protein